jgi:hypothetical protein
LFAEKHLCAILGLLLDGGIMAFNVLLSPRESIGLIISAATQGVLKVANTSFRLCRELWLSIKLLHLIPSCGAFSRPMALLSMPNSMTKI